MIARERVLETLEQIVDPCSCAAGAPVGLVGMGLIRDVEITPQDEGGSCVSVRMVLTSPGCLMGAVFVREIERALYRLPGVRRVEVEIDHGTIWQPGDFAPEYRRKRAEHLLRLQGQLLALRPDAGVEQTFQRELS